MVWCSSLEPLSVSEDIPAELLSRFDVEIQEHTIGTHQFRLLSVRNPDALLDAVTPEEFAVDERLPYWAELWSSSFALAEECLAGETREGQRVLDLGCGLGLAGLAAARKGARVLFADYNPDALAFAAWNIRRNLSPDAYARVAVRAVDWRSPGSLGMFDLVLGADIVYERRNFVPLLDLFDAVLAPGGQAWIADPDRAIGKAFLTLASAHGWQMTTVRNDVLRRGRTSTVAMTRLRREGHG